MVQNTNIFIQENVFKMLPSAKCWPLCSLLCNFPFANSKSYPDSKVHGANMGPIWVLSVPDGPHGVPMNLAIGVVLAMNLTLLALSLEYLGRSRTITWLLMPWFLVSPGHPQQRYWLWRKRDIVFHEE